MMNGGVSPVEPGLFLNVLRVQNLQAGRGQLVVPVASSSSLYANYEHIRGEPVPEGGVPLFRLRVLDRLIDRLLAEGEPVPPVRPGLGAGENEALIGELARRLQDRLAARQSLFGGFNPETGMLVNLLA